MGLLMSDTMLIDPMLDDTTWFKDSLREWSFAPESTRGISERETADLAE